MNEVLITQYMTMMGVLMVSIGLFYAVGLVAFWIVDNEYNPF